MAELQDRQEDAPASAGPTAARSAWRRWWPLLLLGTVSGAALVLLWTSGGVSFDTVREHGSWLMAQVDGRPLTSGLGLFALYAMVTALSLPLATMLTVVAGYLFGVVVGSLWVIAGATLGSVVVFLAARYALHDQLTRRAGPWMKRMEKGFQEDAFSYMLVLRLLPIFPFWLVNLVPALMGVRLWVYVLATALGIVPGVVVYAALGNGLGKILAKGQQPDLTVILDPAVILPLFGLAVLALLPVAWKRWQRRRQTHG